MRTVIEVEGELNERPYIALTAEMMRAFDLHVSIERDWRRFEIEPGQQPRPTTVELPPDIGSAAFGLAVTAIHPSNVLFRGLQKLPGDLLDHPEGAFMEIVREMGLPMTYDANAKAVRVTHDGIELRGVRVDCRDIPDMLPILATLGTLAKGETVLETFATCVSRNRIGSLRCCSSIVWAAASNCTMTGSSRTAFRNSSARISRRSTTIAF